MNPLEKQQGKETEPKRSYFGAVVLVTDFGDNLAPAECELALTREFEENHTISPRLITVHDVEPFSIVHAAFNIHRLANVAGERTILIGVIDPGVGTQRKGVIIQTGKEHYFVGPDNGILYPAAVSEGITGVWHINHSLFPTTSTTFHGRDIFSPVAARLACGFSPNDLGISTDNLVEFDFQIGQILHRDKYGNYKINQTTPKDARGVTLPNGQVVPLVQTFEDVARGELLAYSGSSGILEIAIREGNAAQALGYQIGECLDLQPI